MYGKAFSYLLLSGGLGIVLLYIATPSEQEIEKIKNIGKTNQAFSKVIRAAADPDSKPIYLQKPGQRYPVKEDESDNKK